MSLAAVSLAALSRPAAEVRRLRVTVELEQRPPLDSPESRWLHWSLRTDHSIARVACAVWSMHPYAKSVEVKEG